jgi:hypothetical protein
MRRSAADRKAEAARYRQMTEEALGMKELKCYTLELYKIDRRTKAGKKLISKLDFIGLTEDDLALTVEDYERQGYVVAAHETYVTRTNIITGKEFSERYDTPYFCSPSSETYWSM